ncbi:MAG: hypothetical protein ACPGSD_04775 [Flavobacteriales bacterium]
MHFKEIGLIISILFINTHSVSQDIICEENTVLYSTYYQLDTNGTFTFDFRHCTGCSIGFGVYSKSKRTLKFEFKTLQSPQLTKFNSKEYKNEVNISILHITKGYPLDWTRVDYNGETYRTDSLGQVLLKYSGGPLKVFQYFEKDSLIIQPDLDQINQYIIYWHSGTDTIVHKRKVVVMKKKGDKYFQKRRKVWFIEK